MGRGLRIYHLEIRGSDLLDIAACAALALALRFAHCIRSVFDLKIDSIVVKKSLGKRILQTP